MDRGAWWATVHAVTSSRTQLSNWTHTGNIPSWQIPIEGRKLAVNITLQMGTPRLRGDETLPRSLREPGGGRVGALCQA